MMLMQYAQMVFPQGKVQSHTAPLVIPPSDTVFREHYQRLRVGSQIQIGIFEFALSLVFGIPFACSLRLRCPLRTVLLTVVFTLDGARFLYLPEKQQEDFL